MKKADSVSCYRRPIGVSLKHSTYMNLGKYLEGEEVFEQVAVKIPPGSQNIATYLIFKLLRSTSSTV